MNVKVAILVDGGFFLKRYNSLFSNGIVHTPEEVAKNLFQMCMEHLRHRIDKEDRLDELYRIFYYDCPPLEKKIENPISSKQVDLKKTAEYKFRVDLFKELRKKRKVALRLGYIQDSGFWTFKDPRDFKKIIKQNKNISSIGENDIKWSANQKGVDMRIGVDIASLALKRQVQKIILISGDADFTPAAKLARREGIDFVLDPLWNQIADDLYEHIDGLRTVQKIFKPKQPKSENSTHASNYKKRYNMPSNRKTTTKNSSNQIQIKKSPVKS